MFHSHLHVAYYLEIQLSWNFHNWDEVRHTVFNFIGNYNYDCHNSYRDVFYFCDRFSLFSFKFVEVRIRYDFNLFTTHYVFAYAFVCFLNFSIKFEHWFVCHNECVGHSFNGFVRYAICVCYFASSFADKDSIFGVDFRFYFGSSFAFSFAISFEVLAITFVVFVFVFRRSLVLLEFFYCRTSYALNFFTFYYLLERIEHPRFIESGENTSIYGGSCSARSNVY